MDLISVIVPVYNVREYLEQCVESICSQTYQNLEIILVDDGSNDGSSEICDFFASKDKRIKVIHKTNGGLSDARNAGLDVVTGDYVGFVDSDDYIALNMFQVLYDNIKLYNADISSCRYTESFNDGTLNPIGNDHKIHVYEGTDALKEYLLCKPLDPFVCNKLYKTSFTCISKTSENPLRFIKGIIGEDVPFNIEIFKKLPRIVLTGESLYYYRQQRIGSICTKPLSQKNIDNAFRWEQIRQDISKDFSNLEIFALRRQLLFYLGLYNRIILEKSNYNNEKRIIQTFLKQYKNEIIKSNICEKKLKIATFLLTHVPIVYIKILKIYKKIYKVTRL